MCFSIGCEIELLLFECHIKEKLPRAIWKKGNIIIKNYRICTKVSSKYAKLYNIIY